MEPFDFVLIDYNKESEVGEGRLKKLAILLLEDEVGYMFKDKSGEFGLTKDFVKRQGIKFEVIETD